jgi:hypothetical protein
MRDIKPLRTADTALPFEDELADLTVVGLGLRPWNHMTLEVLDAIRRSDKVLFVGADIMMEKWLQELNPTSERMCDYIPDRPRRETYRVWTDTVLESVRKGLKTCAAAYGHAGVLVMFSRDAIREAREEGYSATMLPGISSEACLICDLGVDPGPRGWQSYGATIFVNTRPRFDTRTPLILWQIHVVDRPGPRNGVDRPGLQRLMETLLESYPADHGVVIYLASRNPAVEPEILTVPLSRLAFARFRGSPSLYVPPLDSTSDSQ